MINDDNYIGWKNWQSKDFGIASAGSILYFDRLFKRINLDVANKIVYEVGFGNGQLLGYLASKGCVLTGSELNQTLVDRAKTSGFSAVHGNSWEQIDSVFKSYDLIVALDVIEHLEFDALNKLFNWAAAHLNEDGAFLVRFPEGASPFGLAYQHGDFTHIMCLTEGKIKSLCQGNGLVVQYYIDEHLKSDRLATFGVFGKVLLLLLQSYARFVRQVLYIVLFPLSGKLKLGTNSIVVFRRKEVQ